MHAKEPRTRHGSDRTSSRAVFGAGLIVVAGAVMSGCAFWLAPAVRPFAPAPTVEVSSDPPTTADETTDESAIRIRVGEEILTATVWDTPASRSLLSQLPLTLEFSDYGGREAVAAPPQPLVMEGMPARDAPLAGDLSYYSPTGMLSLTYADLGEWEGAARLGRIAGDLSFLDSRTEPFTVTLERAD